MHIDPPLLLYAMFLNVRNRFAAPFAATLLSIAALAACSSQNPSPIDSPLNSPLATPNRPLLAATQDVKLGQLRGRLFVKRGQRSVPLKDVIVFLGPIVRSDVTGGEGVVALDQVNAPQSEVDANGLFVIRNVPPGRYGLVVDIDDDKMLLNKPSDGTAFIHEISGNETLDLGDLSYSDLPYVERP